MVPTLVVYLQLFQIVFGSSCFKAGEEYNNPGLNGLTTRVLDGASGSGLCLVAVKDKNLTFPKTNESCAEKFPSGRLMTNVHYDAFIKGWQKTSTLPALNAYWYVDFPVNVTDGCWTVYVNSTFAQQQQWPKAKCNKGYYVCQYPFQYNCAYEKRISDKKADLVQTGGKVYFNVTTVWWQSSDDASMAANCFINASVLQETELKLVKCYDPIFQPQRGDWSTCSGTCARTGGSSVSPTQYRNRKLTVQCRLIIRKAVNLFEIRTCNTHIPCLVATTTITRSRTSSRTTKSGSISIDSLIDTTTAKSTMTTKFVTRTSEKPLRAPSIGNQGTMYGGIVCTTLACISFVLAVVFFMKNKRQT